MRKEIFDRAMDLLYPAKDVMYKVMDESMPELEGAYNAIAEACFLLTTIKTSDRTETVKAHIIDRIAETVSNLLETTALSIENCDEDRDQNDNQILSVSVDDMVEANTAVAQICEMLDVYMLLK